MTKTKPFLSTCYGDPSATEVRPCCEAATRKLTFSTTSVLLLLDVMNPEGQYHTVPSGGGSNTRDDDAPGGNRGSGNLRLCSQSAVRFCFVPRSLGESGYGGDCCVRCSYGEFGYGGSICQSAFH